VRDAEVQPSGISQREELQTPLGALAYGWLPGPPWLLQELGRSALGPVHWPLLPAPFPPSVGGDGFAVAAGARATTSAAAESNAAMDLRVRVISTPFPERRANNSRCRRARRPTVRNHGLERPSAPIVRPDLSETCKQAPHIGEDSGQFSRVNFFQGSILRPDRGSTRAAAGGGASSLPRRPVPGACMGSE
jgi:hypothetical protein